MSQTVICMKWGTRYGPDYVNRLYSMVQRHTKRPTRLVCYTDDPAGLDRGVEDVPAAAYRASAGHNLAALAQAQPLAGKFGRR